VTQTLDDLIRDEVAHAITHEDDPLPARVTVTRPNKGTVLSVRLSDEEYELLCRQAETDGLPVSTTGRRLILTGLRTSMKSEMIEAIRETIAPAMLAR
jgi:hypothetical protein